MDRQVVDLPGHRQFALWDTVSDRFLEISGEQSWECVTDLVASVRDQLKDLVAERSHSVEIDRLMVLQHRCVSLASSVPEYNLPPSDADD